MSVEATATPALPRFDIVFLDLDETLCAWMAPALAKHNLDNKYVFKHVWEPGDGRKVYEILKWTKAKFWAPIDEDPNFWHGLQKLPHCDTLVSLAQSLAPVVSVLSSPHQHENCYGGKHEWIKQYLPPEIGTVLTSEKHLLARPGRLLIDDQDDKVNAFRAAGGSAILIPQHWNSAHAAAPYGVLFYLAQELEKLRREQVIAAAYPLSADRLIGTQDTSDAEISTAQRAGLRRIVALSFPRARAGKFWQRADALPLEPLWPIGEHITPPAGYGPGTNTGHGHAWTRPDGGYAKCMGLASQHSKGCAECNRDFKFFYGDDAEIVKGEPLLAPVLSAIEHSRQISEHIERHISDSPIANVLAADGDVPAENAEAERIAMSNLAAHLPFGYRQQAESLPAEADSPLAELAAELEPAFTVSPPLSSNDCAAISGKMLAAVEAKAFGSEQP